MPSPLIAAVCIALLSLVALLWAEFSGRRWLKIMSKTAGALAFVWGGWISHHGPLPMEQWILAALGLSAVGDVFLLSREKRPFLAGLVAFLLAHVAFMGAFWTLGPGFAAVGWAAAGALLACVGVGTQVFPRLDPTLRVAIGLYMVVISGMVALAIGVWSAGHSALFPIAAIAFFVSDLAVALDRFIAPSFRNKMWGLPMYFGAQWLFVLAMAG